MTNIPEVINAFNVYIDSTALVGISGAVTLPNFEAITEEISGAGILGSYETSIPGHFSSMTQEIPFRILMDDAFSLMKYNEALELTFRASAQSTVKSTGALDYSGLRIVERGRFKSMTGGKLEQGKQMESSVTLELFYIKILLDDDTLLELDKLNSTFIVDGTDMLEDVTENT